MANFANLRKIFVLVSVLTGFLGVNSSFATDPDSSVANKIIYCTACHLKNGAGFKGDVYIPRLAGQTPDYLESQIRSFMAKKRDNPSSIQFMWGAVAGLTPEMIAGIKEYFSKQVAPPSADGPSDKVALGKTIFEQGVPSANVMACNACHGANAEGNGPMPRLAGQSYIYLKQSFTEWRTGFRADAEPMPTYAKSLTEEQIEALAQYLSTLN